MCRSRSAALKQGRIFFTRDAGERLEKTGVTAKKQKDDFDESVRKADASMAKADITGLMKPVQAIASRRYCDGRRR